MTGPGGSRTEAFESVAVAALVAAPFAGFLGVFASSLAGWSSVVLIGVAVSAEVFGTAWIAGVRRRAGE